MPARLSTRHLLGTEELTTYDIEIILERAFYYKKHLLLPKKKSTLLAGKSIVLAFFENSTRTRISFEWAAKRLGADIVSFSSQTSSVQKGESLKDTIHTLEAMQIDAIVMRHPASGAVHHATQLGSSIFINAGDGAHEHPTQGLLDAMTLTEYFSGKKKISPKVLKGKHIAIIGDILYSRVARSNIHTLQKLGAHVAVCGPPTLIPRAIEAMNVITFSKIEEAIAWADALIMLRIQSERQDKGLLPSLEDYSKLFELTRARLGKKVLPILHPGPMNRGVEIESTLADSPNALMRAQVTNGVAIRMAVLDLLLKKKK